MFFRLPDGAARGGELAQCPPVEDHSDQRAAPRYVLELDLAEMLLDDLLDDGEAEPGALGAGGHIGLGHPRPLGGEADAGVGDLDRNLAPLLADGDADAILALAALALLALLLDRLDAVLDDVGQR